MLARQSILADTHVHVGKAGGLQKIYTLRLKHLPHLAQKKKRVSGGRSVTPTPCNTQTHLLHDIF